MRTTALIVVGVLIAAAVAWFAAEQHYENCVDAATAAHPLGEAGLTPADRRDLPSWLDQNREGEDDSELATQEVEDRPRQRRKAAIEGCSRLPW